uniref:Uncharacterized protein n=1 Tax=Octopus bimaculoides TaxID=37653 RepID=A0A0L8HWP0_OCTBM
MKAINPTMEIHSYTHRYDRLSTKFEEDLFWQRNICTDCTLMFIYTRIVRI